MPSRFRKVKPDAMVTDLAVQRSLNKRRAQQMADEFNPNALGVITVSCRKDGTFIILDGQHRMEAARLAGQGDVAVQCEVFDDLTLADEARIFLARNKTRAPGAQDKFRVRLTEREESAVTIEAILDNHGWKTGKITSGDTLAAVGVLDRLHRLDPDQEIGVIDRAARIITAAWGHTRGATHGALWDGVGALVARYGDALDDGAVTRHLERWGPDGTLAQAMPWRSSLRRHSDAIAQAIVMQYNKGRTSRALPPWV